MIKLVYCITRKPGLSPEEFSRYWEHVHGPIGRRIPGLRRLVQSHAVAHPSGFPPADFDGVAELWFDDLAAIGAPVARAAGLNRGRGQLRRPGALRTLPDR